MSSRSPRAEPACLLCGRPSSAAHKPFCGTACRDRDLLQWLGEGYRIPGPPLGPDEANAHEV